MSYGEVIVRFIRAPQQPDRALRNFDIVSRILPQQLAMRLAAVMGRCGHVAGRDCSAPVGRGIRLAAVDHVHLVKGNLPGLERDVDDF